LQVRFRVFVDGEELGYSLYNTVVDLWGDAVYTDFDCTNPRGEYTCQDPNHDHSGAAMLAHHKDDGERYGFRWCGECRCIVTPPFDGYVYHEYDCAAEGDYDNLSCECGV
jgi:hypothetical protein